jgi:FMN phosphatase YigB (HAD superfamily)
LSRFPVVLLDMNGTVMFGGDRFGPEQDFAATYRALGGRRLAAGMVQETIAACYATMGAIYEDPARCDSFPTVSDTLRALPAGRDLPEAELELLERAIAQHELGRIPDAYARAITRLAAAHRLGLVANILSRKRPWLEEFERAGVLHHFATTVFSSDTSSIKPSRKLFDQAVTALAAPRSEVVFVGDSLRCDIGGATAAGLAAVWIDRAGHGRQPGDPQPTFVVRDLLDLVA